MTKAQYDVVGIGNAIVDVISHADDAFIERHKLLKGAMRLIDGSEAETLYDRMGPGIEMSGGSAANTIAGVASLGGTGAFIGKVCDDQLGRIYRHDMRAGGIHFGTPAATDGPATARSLILVTPDAQRTMNTFLGAAVNLGPEDIDHDVIRDSAVTYMEGYLFDKDPAKAAFRLAAQIAHEAGRLVSFTLSDPFCVDRHRADFLDLLKGHTDILFANEAEIMSLYETEDFDTAVNAVRGHCSVACVTRSEKGSVVISEDETVEVPAAPIDTLEDTTGAGDLYAAGVLFGYTHQYDLATAGRIGAIAAAEIIQQIGPRPQTSLAAKIADAGIATSS